MLIQADEFDYDTDAHVVTARGHVEVDSDGRMLLADEVTYDQNTDKTTASGHVSLTDEKGNVAFSDHVELTDKMRDGVLHSFAALIGKSGRMVASGARRSQGRFIEAFRRRLYALQDLQPAGPAHAGVAGRGRPRRL